MSSNPNIDAGLMIILTGWVITTVVVVYRILNNPWRELGRYYGSDHRDAAPSIPSCWIDVQRFHRDQNWRISGFADAHFPQATLCVHTTGLEIWFPIVSISWIGIRLRPVRFQSLFAPWNEVEITARRGSYEYSGPVIFQFEKTRNIGIRISGVVMNRLMELGAPFRLSENGQVVRTVTVTSATS